MECAPAWGSATTRGLRSAVEEAALQAAAARCSASGGGAGRIRVGCSEHGAGHTQAQRALAQGAASTRKRKPVAVCRQAAGLACFLDTHTQAWSWPQYRARMRIGGGEHDGRAMANEEGASLS